MTGRLYFLRPVGAEGPVKIGHSGWPEERLVAAMRWSPVPLELVAHIPGGYQLELQYHAKFAAYRLHHEWFRPAAPVLEAVELARAGLAIEFPPDFDAKRILSEPRRVRHAMQLRFRALQRALGHSHLIPTRADEMFALWRMECRAPSEAETAEINEIFAEMRRQIDGAAKPLPVRSHVASSCYADPPTPMRYNSAPRVAPNDTVGAA